MSSNANTARIVTGGGAVQIRLSPSHVRYLELIGGDAHLIDSTTIEVPLSAFERFVARVESLAGRHSGFQTYKNFRKRIRNAAELVDRRG